VLQSFAECCCAFGGSFRALFGVLVPRVLLEFVLFAFDVAIILGVACMC
jgi:hypothetical protein